jgi:hypothetical protein
MQGTFTMNSFDYSRFVELSSSDLYAYVEPFLNPSVPIPQNVLQRMLSDLPNYDEPHLAYAIELGPDHAPDLFAPVLASYLSHNSQAIRCSASRALSRLPKRLLTKNLVDIARTALVSSPEREREIWDTVLEGLDKQRGA